MNGLLTLDSQREDVEVQKMRTDETGRLPVTTEEPQEERLRELPVEAVSFAAFLH